MAALQLFGRKRDRETQRGERWLKERRIVFSFVDLDLKALAPGELDSIARATGGHQALVDTQGAEFKKGGWAHRSYDPREELLEHPGLVRTPVLRLGPRAVVGFDETAWKALAEQAGPGAK
jgi:arsenate reductase-like glutaredoxin family protein